MFGAPMWTRPNGKQIGVMVDDVEAMRPDALGPTINGQRTVNYDTLGIPPPKNGGMFGATPNWVNAVQAGIGGYLQGRGVPGGGQLLQQLHERQMMAQRQAMEEAQYQQHRGDDLSDYGKKLEMASKYKEPHVNDTVADYEFIRQQLGDEGARRFLETKTNPIVMTPYGPMPYSAVSGGAQQAPAKPLTDEDILRMQGGPTPQASGGFPGSY